MQSNYSAIAVFSMSSDGTYNRLSIEMEAKRAPKVVITGNAVQQEMQDSPHRLPEAVKRPYINKVGLYSVRQSELRKEQLLAQIKATRAEIRAIATPMTTKHINKTTTARANPTLVKQALQALQNIDKLVSSIFVNRYKMSI